MGGNNDIRHQMMMVVDREVTETLRPDVVLERSDNSIFTSRRNIICKEKKIKEQKNKIYNAYKILKKT